jgi:CheY-like chemotaxis protein
MTEPRGSKILVIDDNPTNLKLASAVLVADGFEVTTAADAEEAMDVLRRERPALAYCDIQLPDVDGIELTRRIKADPDLYGTIVVALTAYAMEADRDRALAAGCDGFISKPIDTRTLGLQTRSFLAHAPTRAPAHARATDPSPSEARR